MFMLNQTHTGAMLMIAGAVIGIGYGSVTPIFQTQTINAVEPHRVGIANSLFFNSMDLGNGCWFLYIRNCGKCIRLS